MGNSVELEVRSLTKVFGRGDGVRAVSDLSFRVEPGRVTGFLGPNGSGKTTTLRCLLGLVSPTSGETLVGGRPYRELHDPLRIVGAALEASGFHPGRTARGHLRVVAASAGIPRTRVTEVLELVGLAEAGHRKVGGYSLGMRQRLSLATALLGDPAVLILDEPANGLDPEGIAWLRNSLRALAAEGRTVLVSSHVLSEVQLTVDDVVIIRKGELVSYGSLDALSSGMNAPVIVRSPDAIRLAESISQASAASITTDASGALLVTGMTAEEIGALAFAHNVMLHELHVQEHDLEAVFLELTSSEGGAA
ncbi:MAG: ATP-binding cassette domain-containing protein [Candidatus Nanopelagicales bacterium]